ncbi:MAG: hypothetical protein NT138_10265 [Planctomycetales bacterium]|nr:hypothetical protein [Planctomycetales bacterium]
MVMVARPRFAIFLSHVVAALSLLVAGCSNPLPPAEEVRFDSPYTVMAQSADGDIIALGTGLEAQYYHDHSKSQLLLLNAKTLRPLFKPIPYPNWVSQVAYVSRDFGFVVAVSEDLRDAKFEMDERPEESGSIHRVMLDGTTQLVADGIPTPIVSVAVSSDARIAAVCTAGDAYRDATCKFICLEDGRTLATFSPEYCLHLSASFGEDPEFCLLATDGRSEPALSMPEARRNTMAYKAGTRLFLIKTADATVADEEVVNKDSGRGISIRISGNQMDEKVIMHPRDVEVYRLKGDKIGGGTKLDLTKLSARTPMGATDFDIDPERQWMAAASTYDGSDMGCNVSFFNMKNNDVASREIVRRNHLYQVLFSKNGQWLDVLVMSKPDLNSVLARYDLRALLVTTKSE